MDLKSSYWQKSQRMTLKVAGVCLNWASATLTTTLNLKSRLVQGLYHHLWILLLCLGLMQLVQFLVVTPLVQAQPLIDQEIRYHMPEAGEVFLVWGLDGWQLIPENLRPAGTEVEFGVMHTPMVLEGDTFVATLQVPVDRSLDYGFQIRKTRSGEAIDEWLWDGDYSLTPTQDNVVEVQAAVTLAQGQVTPSDADGSLVMQEFRYHSSEASEVYLVWGVNSWQVMPETTRPPGTVIQDKVMRTPMTRDGDTFVAHVQVPKGTTLDYGFLVTKTPSGAQVAVWDADGAQDYHTVAGENGVIDVQATPHLVRQVATNNFDINLQWHEFLALLVGSALISGGGALYYRRASLKIS